VVLCWLPKVKPGGYPKGNRDPKPDEIEFCRAAHWGKLYRTLGDDELVVAVGTPATQALLGVEKAGKYIGTFNRRP